MIFVVNRPEVCNADDEINTINSTEKLQATDRYYTFRTY
jgi:hypothetical protein